MAIEGGEDGHAADDDADELFAGAGEEEEGVNLVRSQMNCEWVDILQE